MQQRPFERPLTRRGLFYYNINRQDLQAEGWDLGWSAVFSWASGMVWGRLASQRGCWEAASLRKLGKQSFPNLRNLAAGCGYGAWGRRGRLPLTNLEYGSQALPLFEILAPPF